MSLTRFGLLTAAAVLTSATLASAQHADFVLFGTNKPAAAVKPEQKFVHPISSPYFHEDSFVTSDVRAWFVYHNFPSGGVINGGDAKVYAAQVRLALTD